MQNLEVIQRATSQGDAVVIAKDINFSVDINTGAITINGKQTFALSDGSTRTMALPMTSVRLAERKIMADSMQPGDAKNKELAKITIWETALDAFKPVVSALLVSDYDLENPIV